MLLLLLRERITPRLIQLLQLDLHHLHGLHERPLIKLPLLIHEHEGGKRRLHLLLLFRLLHHLLHHLVLLHHHHLVLIEGHVGGEVVGLHGRVCWGDEGVGVTGWERLFKCLKGEDQ